MKLQILDTKQVIMRPSKIEARRVFTRYGWQPINATNFLTSRDKQAKITLESENEDYKMCIFESGGRKKIRLYAQVTDRRCNVRYYLTAIWHKVRYADMKNDLKLNLI